MPEKKVAKSNVPESRVSQTARKPMTPTEQKALVLKQAEAAALIATLGLWSFIADMEGWKVEFLRLFPRYVALGMLVLAFPVSIVLFVRYCKMKG